MITYKSNSFSDTLKLGTILEQIIPDGSVLSLTGTLGAGKTALVKAIAEAGGENAANISSPTFVLIQEYTTGRRPIYHFDAYRIADDDEFLELGPEEYFDSNGITFVEWADRVENCLPENIIKIEVLQTDDNSRIYNFSATGANYSAFIEALSKKLSFFP